MTSTLRAAIDLFNQIGLYDVVLPFLLVFTLMYAFLDKTRVLGTEKFYKSDGSTIDIPRKNLNAMIAFTTGLFVVLSSQLVSIISQVLAQTVLLLMLCFLVVLTVGSFMRQTSDGVFFGPDANGKVQNPGLYYGLMVVAVTAVVFIFLNAIKTGSGQSWLSYLFNGAESAFTSGGSQVWSAIILGIVLLGGIIFIVRGSPLPRKEDG